MKREIKFRGWNKETKQMIDLKKITPFALDEGLKIDGLFLPFSESMVLMQFTGLKDKSGVDVYESDIVKAWSQGSCATFQIKWRQEGSPCWILYPAWQSQQMWYLSASEYTKDKIFITVSGERVGKDKEGFYDDGIEVIGNIWENPEFVEKS